MQKISTKLPMLTLLFSLMLITSRANPLVVSNSSDNKDSKEKPLKMQPKKMMQAVDFAGGSGTEADPYLVADATQLNDVRNFPTAYFKQTGNIDLNVSPYNEGDGWQAMGGHNGEERFSGTYDGDGFIIDGLFINSPDTKKLVGLFGYVSAGTIKNLKLTNVNITGYGDVGSLSAKVSGSCTIVNCSASGNITGYINSDSYGSTTAGGLIGKMGVADETTTIDNCSFSGSVNGTESVGGLVGDLSYTTMNQCYSEGTITASANNAGGLVSSTFHAEIYNSFSRASVTSTAEYAGGLVGFHTFSSKITKCYSTGSVSASSSTYIGGLVGYNYTSTTTGSFWDKETSGITTGTDGSGKTTEQMKTEATFTGASWDLTSVWGISSSENNGYPYLRWAVTTTETAPSLTTTAISNISQTTATSGGNVTADGGATVTARGVCWGTTSNPTIDGNKTSDGSGTGEFTSSISGLTPNTTYYARAYATNSVGTAYGNEVSFTTLNETSTVVVPTVSSNIIYDITQTTASGGGNVTTDGGATVTARGMVWSTSQTPTIESNQGLSTDGTGTGAFSSALTGLTSNTTYYARAYATNSEGTAYGEEVSFTTLGGDDPLISDVDDDYTTANVLTVNDSILQKIDETLDTKDWFKVDLIAGNEYDFIVRKHADDFNNEFGFDCKIYSDPTSFSLQYYYVAFEDMRNDEFKITPETGGTYYIEVIAFLNGGRYYVRVDQVSSTPVVADFSASLTEGEAPLAVNFTDLSAGNITSWSWDFDNDGTEDSDLQNPSFTYTVAGTYTVALTVSDGLTNSTETKTDYITVTEPAGTDINNASDANVRLYPNPAKGIVKIALNNPTAANYIEVFDMSGAKILHKECSASNESEITLNLNGIEKGIYFVKVTDKSKSSIAKLVVE